MQTVNELKPAIGATITVRFEQVRVLCLVIDAKSSYGRARFLVNPLGTNPTNTQWVELERFSQPNFVEGMAAKNYPTLLARRAEAMRQGDSPTIGQVESDIIEESAR
jgi:hypothetical protein